MKLIDTCNLILLFLYLAISRFENHISQSKDQVTRCLVKTSWLPFSESQLSHFSRGGEGDEEQRVFIIGRSSLPLGGDTAEALCDFQLEKLIQESAHRQVCFHEFHPPCLHPLKKYNKNMYVNSFKKNMEKMYTVQENNFTLREI